MDRSSLIKYVNATIAGGDAQTSPLGFDVEAIADELMGQSKDVDLSTVDPTVIWAAVNKHRRQA